MTRTVKSSIVASVIAVTIATTGIMTVSSITFPSPLFAQSMKAQSTIISPKLQRTVRKQSQNPQFMSQALGAGDEIDDCMKNPSNAHVDYATRLAGCFCLSIDNALKGCQSAD
ncbi:hypothetical protein K1W69_01675 [Hoeflea sp. WL0058]|uniref:Uncharacterized protein n=1 Tax=Flavimaribacter sediminis TaxID=2865987 RepID=A0AAE2ZJP3_9HYPH|nr:hypothetical protein [Flavimaribacter sediminis]MBW8635877.1 hypothetical protein [Flavimaribacter sediminis]